MQESFENSVKNMLTIIGEDPNREGLIKTPERVYKAFNAKYRVLQPLRAPFAAYYRPRACGVHPKWQGRWP